MRWVLVVYLHFHNFLTAGLKSSVFYARCGMKSLILLALLAICQSAYATKFTITGALHTLRDNMGGSDTDFLTLKA